MFAIGRLQSKISKISKINNLTYVVKRNINWKNLTEDASSKINNITDTANELTAQSTMIMLDKSIKTLKLTENKLREQKLFGTVITVSLTLGPVQLSISETVTETTKE